MNQTLRVAVPGGNEVGSSTGSPLLVAVETSTTGVRKGNGPAAGMINAPEQRSFVGAAARSEVELRPMINAARTPASHNEAVRRRHTRARRSRKRLKYILRCQVRQLMDSARKLALKGLFKMSITPLSSLETRRGGDLTVHYKPRGDPEFNFLATLLVVRHWPARIDQGGCLDW